MDGDDANPLGLTGYALHKSKIMFGQMLKRVRRGRQVRNARDYKARLESQDPNHPDLDPLAQLLDDSKIVTELAFFLEQMDHDHRIDLLQKLTHMEGYPDFVPRCSWSAS